MIHDHVEFSKFLNLRIFVCGGWGEPRGRGVAKFKCRGSANGSDLLHPYEESWSRDPGTEPDLESAIGTDGDCPIRRPYDLADAVDGNIVETHTAKS
jgi:hypothetical protein